MRTVVLNLGAVLENHRYNTVLHHLTKLDVAQGLEARTAYLTQNYHWYSTKIMETNLAGNVVRGVAH